MAPAACAARASGPGPASLSARRPPVPTMPPILRPTCSRRPARPSRPALTSSATSPISRPKEGGLYLVIVLDLFSRAILGWKIAASMDASLVTDALRRAFDQRLIATNTLFHCDRGSQYSAGSTRRLLARCDLRQSMSASGYCYDNAFAESAFASIKSELLEDGAPFPSQAAASSAVFDYIETFYNRRRLHGSLGYVSPQTFLDNYFQNLNPSLN